MSMKFSDFPKVCVEITLSEGEMVQSRLSLSDAFICLGGNPSLWEWLSLYAQKKEAPLPPFLWETPFQTEVMGALQKIPFGKTVSYQQLALLSKQPQAARAVGNACHRNRFPLFVPCHRVIRSNGELGGFALDLEIKRRLLEFENYFAFSTLTSGVATVCADCEAVWGAEG